MKKNLSMETKTNVFEILLYQLDFIDNDMFKKNQKLHIN